MVNVPKQCWNLHQSTSIILTDYKQFSLKKSLLLTCQTLRLRVNTLATYEKYPVLNRDNLSIPIDMQLSEKQKTFSEFFDAFLRSTLNSKYFEKKVVPHGFCFSEITDSHKVVR